MDHTEYHNEQHLSKVVNKNSYIMGRGVNETPTPTDRNAKRSSTTSQKSTILRKNNGKLDPTLLSKTDLAAIRLYLEKVEKSSGYKKNYHYKDDNTPNRKKDDINDSSYLDEDLSIKYNKRSSSRKRLNNESSTKNRIKQNKNGKTQEQYIRKDEIPESSNSRSYRVKNYKHDDGTVIFSIRQNNENVSNNQNNKGFKKLDKNFDRNDPNYNKNSYMKDKTDFDNYNGKITLNQEELTVEGDVELINAPQDTMVSNNTVQNNQANDTFSSSNDGSSRVKNSNILDNDKNIASDMIPDTTRASKNVNVGGKKRHYKDNLPSDMVTSKKSSDDSTEHLYNKIMNTENDNFLHPNDNRYTPNKQNAKNTDQSPNKSKNRDRADNDYRDYKNYPKNDKNSKQKDSKNEGDYSKNERPQNQNNDNHLDNDDFQEYEELKLVGRDSPMNDKKYKGHRHNKNPKNYDEKNNLQSPNSPNDNQNQKSSRKSFEPSIGNTQKVERLLHNDTADFDDISLDGQDYIKDSNVIDLPDKNKPKKIFANENWKIQFSDIIHNKSNPGDFLGQRIPER